MDKTLNIDAARSDDSQLPTPQEGVESRPQGTAMPRRTFLKFGVSGLALSMVQGASLAQSQSTAGANDGYAKDTDARLGVVVIGVDGADLTAPYLDDYLSVGATVWQYSENTIDFDRFDSIDIFVAANSSKVTLAKSYSDILPSERARLPSSSAFKICGRLSGRGVGAGLQTKVLTIIFLTRRWRTFLSITTGLRMGNLAYQLSNSFGGRLLDPTTPLSVAGKYMVDQIDQMQEIGISGRLHPLERADQPRYYQ